MLIKSPCRDCTNRYAGCHAECEDYKAFRVEVDADREKKQNFDKGFKLTDFYIGEKITRKRG